MLAGLVGMKPQDGAEAQEAGGRWSSEFVSGLKDIFVNDPKVDSDCAIIASRILKAIGVNIQGSANAADLAKEIKSCLHGHGIHSSTIQPEFLDDDDATEDMCLLECAKGCEDDTCCAKRRPTITVQSEPN